MWGLGYNRPFTPLNILQHTYITSSSESSSTIVVKTGPADRSVSSHTLAVTGTGTSRLSNFSQANTMIKNLLKLY